MESNYSADNEFAFDSSSQKQIETNFSVCLINKIQNNGAQVDALDFVGDQREAKAIKTEKLTNLITQFATFSSLSLTIVQREVPQLK